MSASWSDCPGVVSDLKVLGGRAVFVGTRVPVNDLMDRLLHAGDRATDFLNQNPTVSRGQLRGVLDFLADAWTDDPDELPEPGNDRIAAVVAEYLATVQPRLARVRAWRRELSGVER